MGGGGGRGERGLRGTRHTHSIMVEEWREGMWGRRLREDDFNEQVINDNLIGREGGKGGLGDGVKEGVKK